MAKQKIEMEPAASSVAPGTLSLLVSLTNRAFARVEMTEIKFERESAGPPARYKYTLSATDGREWEQDILFDRADDPGMTFSVSDYWRESSEFAEFRQLRSTLIRCAIDHGMVSFKSEWE